MSAAASLDAPALPVSELARIWSRHLVSLLLPANALVFLISGPHPWYIAPLFLVPIGVAYAFDGADRVELRQPSPALPSWPFDALVYGLAALQLWLVVELGRMFSAQAFFSIDTLLVFVIVGASSGFSIITAHELIHRPNRWDQRLGRLLLCTVLNEHFYTEHLRGHHVRVGTADDPATARFGEPYHSFYWRTIKGQFASAWQLEAKRVGAPTLANLSRNRVVQGLLVGWAIALSIGFAGGAVAFAAFAIQAFSASRLLEAVNYFEHWGLVRRGRRVGPSDSWDTHAWFTYYGLTGLSRHADHHAEPARPFQQLRVLDEAPVLPGGYVRMVDMVVGKNAEFQQAATAELRRRRLGPFADPQPDASLAAAPAAPPASTPHPVRRALTFAAALVAVSVGALWESNGIGVAGFGPMLVSNLWIAAVFALSIQVHAITEGRIANDGIRWAIAYAVLIGLGRATDWFVA